jgi:hypothetical protein
MAEYGPQTDEIKILISSYSELSFPKAEKLYRIGLHKDRNFVHIIVWTACERSGRNVLWNDLWLEAWKSAREFKISDGLAPWISDAVWDAFRDALLALLIRDKISEEHFWVLYGPWAETEK